MDLLDRLAGHDAWTTRLLLERCRELEDAALDTTIDAGWGTLRETFAHLVRNMEIWSDLVAERPPRTGPGDTSLAGLIARLDVAAPDLLAVARRVTDEGRLDEVMVDRLNDPPTRLTRGTALLHVLTHSMHHRAEALHMMARLGLRDLPEGDAISWEHAGAWLPRSRD
jgi:uncharacterized damage-inducible protein DinB